MSSFASRDSAGNLELICLSIFSEDRGVAELIKQIVAINDYEFHELCRE